MRIENIKEFSKRTKNSKSTIYRFYKKNPDLWSETKMKSNKRVFPVEHARYFDSEIMFEENKLLRQENQSMKNLIDGLMDKDSLATRLWYMDWTFFGTVAYKADRNKKSCFKMMNTLYESLTDKYGKNAEIRMFFSTEPFANRVGYHNHFTLYVSDKKLHEQIKAVIADFFVMDRIDVELYDRLQGGLFYTAKKGLVNEDWDILFNRLNPNTTDTMLEAA